MLNCHVAKIDETWSVDESDLPPESIRYLIEYGVKQSVNDTHAAVKSKDFATVELYHDAVRAKAEKRWNQILSGDVPGTRGAKKPTMTKRGKQVAAACEQLTDEQFAAVLAQVASFHQVAA